jgi:hypothetical protein
VESYSAALFCAFVTTAIANAAILENNLFILINTFN